MRVRTLIDFEEDDFDRLLALSYPDEGPVIVAEPFGVARAKTIGLEVSRGAAVLNMSFYPLTADGRAGRSIRFWRRQLPDRPGHHDRWVRLVIGDAATDVLVVALAALWSGQQLDDGLPDADERAVQRGVGR